MPQPCSAPLLAACLVWLAACSADSYTRDADREVDSILTGARERVLGDRAEWVLRPPPSPEAPASGDSKGSEDLAPRDPSAPLGAAANGGAPPNADSEASPGTPGSRDTAANPEQTAPQHTAPQPAAPQPAAPQTATATATPSATPTAPDAQLPIRTAEIYDLERALRTAVAGNREFLARREGLYQQGLAYSLARFQFGPQWTAAVSYLWNSSQTGADSQGAGAQLGMSQILPTGGTLALTSGLNGTFPLGGGDDGYASSVGASLRQPLLRGAGYEISHEGLTQAERGLVYAIRDFELFRENFSIQIARTFYDLVRQRQQLANQDQNYESAVFDRKKAEALQRVDRNTEQEVFRARRREIEAQDQLIDARAAFDRALDEFKILLGLPTTEAIDVAESEPPFERVRIGEQDAVAAARHNRLDLLSEVQQLEDSQRALRIAENGLLPDLDLVASYGLVGSDSTLDGAAPDRWDASVGVQMNIPLQQKGQRNGYRLAQIALEQAQRNHALRLDQLDLDIRDALRRLKSVEERIDLQQEQIEQERGAVTVTEIRYQSGKLDNRDLLEARQALVNARNELIGLKVEHFVGRLSLLRDMGLFFVDERGQWSREVRP